jgi:mannose-6-phosphate isomerase-like protein (cupin superfamily)
MPDFATMPLPAEPVGFAPDGSAVRPLVALAGGSLAHFTLAAGQVAQAVAHRTVAELWYCLSGRGALWRRQDGREEVVVLEPGVSATIPLGTHFQFRAAADAALVVLITTMPAWPGDGEAYAVTGRWPTGQAG